MVVIATKIEDVHAACCLFQREVALPGQLARDLLFVIPPSPEVRRRFDEDNSYLRRGSGAEKSEFVVELIVEDEGPLTIRLGLRAQDFVELR